MDALAIAQLLRPFLPDVDRRSDLLASVQTYLELLLRWNRRLNLSAIRDEQNIVIRHFRESFFAAAHWLPRVDAAGAQAAPPTVVDVGSGAGFPGIPLKLFAPEIALTLVEAHGKKATFLREVVRALRLNDVTVLNCRVEALVEPVASVTADLVTLRAVEQFESILPIAARLVHPGGRLGLLIGSAQERRAAELLPGWRWNAPLRIPRSDARVLLSGSPPG
jgi:16S rRNA (guanine527-N7)-methyltransferase